MLPWDMAVMLTEEESVRRDGKPWEIGEKVYANRLGVVYIQEIEVLGVHLGFRAKVTGCTTDGEVLVDSHNLSKEPTDEQKQMLENYEHTDRI